MSLSSMVRRVAAPAALTLTSLTAACGSDALSPQSGLDPALEKQMAANLAVMKQAQARSAAVYDSLANVWKTRGDRTGGMMSSTSSPLVACAPLPYDGEAKIVSTAGGVFHFGPHTLTVPAGALSATTAMAVIVETDLKARVTLLPHGTQFAVPVKLSLAYSHCETAPSHRVAYVDSLDNIIEWPASADRPELQMVDTWLNHFSTYAIAY